MEIRFVGDDPGLAHPIAFFDAVSSDSARTLPTSISKYREWSPTRQACGF
jgi:hypothetical protein